MTGVPFSEFAAAHTRWLDDCLEEFNRWVQGRFVGARRFHQDSDGAEDCDPDDLVEFGNDGSAYPHSRAGGTNFIPRVVTRWSASPHYAE